MRSARIALNAVASRPAHRPPIQPAPTTAPKNSRNGARSVDIQEERKTLTHRATAGHRMPAQRALIQGRLLAGNREMICRIEAISRTLSVGHSIRYFILQLNRLLHNSWPRLGQQRVVDQLAASDRRRRKMGRHGGRPSLKTNTSWSKAGKAGTVASPRRPCWHGRLWSPGPLGDRTLPSGDINLHPEIWESCSSLTQWAFAPRKEPDFVA
jgi:hypothetical protein